MRNKKSEETNENIGLASLFRDFKSFKEEEKQKSVPTGFAGSTH
jgi:hypothetical protein